MRRQHEGPPRRRTQAARQRTGVQHQGQTAFAAASLTSAVAVVVDAMPGPITAASQAASAASNARCPRVISPCPFCPSPSTNASGTARPLPAPRWQRWRSAICRRPRAMQLPGQQCRTGHAHRAPTTNTRPRCSLSPPGDGSGIARSAAAVSVRRRAAAISALQPGDRIRWSPAHRPALAARTWCAPVAAIAHRPRPHVR